MLVGDLGFATGQEFLQLGVDGVVDGGRLVVGQQLLPAGVGPLGRGERALLRPLLVAVVVGYLRAPEGGLEVGQGVGVAQEVVAMGVGAKRL